MQLHRTSAKLVNRRLFFAHRYSVGSVRSSRRYRVWAVSGTGTDIGRGQCQVLAQI
jgi:hypothetical protein